MKKILLIIIIAFTNKVFAQSVNYINQHIDTIFKYEKHIKYVSKNIITVDTEVIKTQYMFKNNICYSYIVFFHNKELFDTFTKTYTIKQNKYQNSNIKVIYKPRTIIYEKR